MSVGRCRCECRPKWMSIPADVDEVVGRSASARAMGSAATVVAAGRYGLAPVAGRMVLAADGVVLTADGDGAGGGWDGADSGKGGADSGWNGDRGGGHDSQWRSVAQGWRSSMRGPE